jgi:hypothetical protein
MSTALAVALLGVVIAAASLWWQAWTWYRSGPQIDLSISNQFPTDGDKLGDHLVALTVVNMGRAATTIEAWGIQLPDKSNVIPWNCPQWFVQLPHRLEPHSSVDLRINASELRQLAAARKVLFHELRPWVRTGDGRQHFVKGVPLS